MSARALTAAALSAALAIAPIAARADWHGRYYHHGNGGAAVGAAIAGGLLGFGLGAAMSSGYPYGYYAPPPVYYGYSPYYYAPPPPVYYGW